MVGIIEAKTPFMGGGYWKSGTRQPFHEWFIGNDQGYFDSDGRLVVTGRNSDLITGAVMLTAIEDAAYRLSDSVEYVTVTPGSGENFDATVFIQSAQFHLHQLARDTLARHFPTLQLAVVVLRRSPHRAKQTRPPRARRSPPSHRELMARHSRSRGTEDLTVSCPLGGAGGFRRCQSEPRDAFGCHRG